MSHSFERECLLSDVALGMRAHTLGDVAVMLGLAWRVLDLQASSEFDEKSRDQALVKIWHPLLTSLDAVIKEDWARHRRNLSARMFKPSSTESMPIWEMGCRSCGGPFYCADPRVQGEDGQGNVVSALFSTHTSARSSLRLQR
jgi:hypothetical protein